MNIRDVTTGSQLREFMSAPGEGVVGCVRKVQGDILVLGGSGKMGPELTEMIVRADAIATVRSGSAITLITNPTTSCKRLTLRASSRISESLATLTPPACLSP